MVDSDELVGFQAQIKPLFREGDRDAMRAHFDLWSYNDVSEHADAILSRLVEGSMRATARGPTPRSTSSNDGRKTGSSPSRLRR